jgi:LysR family carnitine catabolism transcriptional activator
MIDFTSRQLRAFLLVAQHRSFTRAAGALFITPSGLSVLIRELENQLGVRLFDRTTRRVALTSHGVELSNVARRALEELDTTLSHLARSPAERNPSIAVGAPPLWAAVHLAQAMKEFRLQRPNVRFQVSDSDSASTLQKVESGILDMGLGFFFKHVPGIRRTPLFSFSLIVIRPKTRNATRRATTTWSALKGEDFVAVRPSIPVQQFIEKHFAKAGVAYQPKLVLNYLSTQIAMVEAGEGVAVIPSFALSECQNRQILVSSLVQPVVRLDFYQIRQGGKVLSPIAEEFTSFLRSYIARSAEKSTRL